MSDELKPCPVCGKSARANYELASKPMASCDNLECWMCGIGFHLEVWNEPRPLEESLLVHITDYNNDVKEIALRVIAFASQLEAWGHAPAAQEILVEILGGKVNAPDYYKLKDENDALRARVVELEAALKAANEDAERLAVWLQVLLEAFVGERDIHINGERPLDAINAHRTRVGAKLEGGESVMDSPDKEA